MSVFLSGVHSYLYLERVAEWLKRISLHALVCTEPT